MESTLLLDSYLKRLRLPAVAKHYGPLARQAAQAKQGFEDYLLALLEQEVLQREENQLRRRIKQARFPVLKTLADFDFGALPSLNPHKVLNLAEGGYIERQEVVILMGNAGTGKTHLAIALGLEACRKGRRVRFTTAAGLINELVEAREAHRLSRVEAMLDKMDLLILDEIGYVPFSRSGAELLFHVCAARYERGSLIITTNLPFSQWTEVFGDERLTGALLDRLTHHCHILEINGESYRFKQSLKKREAKDQ